MSQSEPAATESSPVEGVPATLFQAAADREATEQAIAAAGPVVVDSRPDLALASTLAPGQRVAVVALLASLADNKYMLGRRYAEWCTGAPLLESAVAASAMAQDELGHARSFYPVLRGFKEAAHLNVSAMEEPGWSLRPNTAMAYLSQRFSSWSGFIAANLVVDAAFTTLLESATHSVYEPLRQRASKIVQEEANHRVHAENWTRQLARAEHHRAALQAAIHTAYGDAAAWFTTIPCDVLASDGILAADSATLRQVLDAYLSAALASSSMAIAVD